MIFRHIRWQFAMAVLGVALLLTVLFALSRTVQPMILAQPGGTYVEGLASAPENLNPLYSQNRTDYDLAGLLFNSLLKPDETGALQPELARAWSVSEDGRTYTFRLRSNVRWHDGQPFTAADVLYTIRVLQDPDYRANAALSEIWRRVESVEAPNERTVVVTLPASLAPFAPFASFATFPILPSHLLQEVPVSALADYPFSVAPVGTGPWQVERVTTGFIALVPHRAPFRGHAPALQRLIFRFYDSPEAVLSAYERGEVMGIGQVASPSVQAILNDPTITPYFTPLSGYSALFFNLRSEPLQDRAVREGLMLGLDRQFLIDSTLNGTGQLADGFLMPTHWAYDPTLMRYPYAPAQAAARLDSAGWVEVTAPSNHQVPDSGNPGLREKDGTPFALRLLISPNSQTQVEVAEEIERQWEKLGVAVVIQAAESNSDFQNAVKKHDFDVVLLAPPPQGVPADPDFYPQWHSSQIATGGNITGFSNERADQILVEARRTLDPEGRTRYYNEFQSILATELPALPLYHPVYTYAISRMVHDVQLAPMTTTSDRFASINDWYMRTRRLLIAQGQATPTPAIESYRRHQ